MNLVKQSPENLTLQLTRDEAALLSNALNESLEGLDDWEFEIRMGAPKEEVAKLLAAFGQISAPEQTAD